MIKKISEDNQPKPNSFINIVKQKHNSYAIIIFLLILGIFLRILVAFRGFNYDFESFLIVVNNLDQNNNIYSLTDRYNYGPIWFLIIRFLFKISSKNPYYFRYAVVLFLTLVDIGIFWILLKKYGRYAGLFFLLNPISIIISGYHNQFDNLAILLGLTSVIILENNKNKISNKKYFLGLTILGLSLITKHLFFLFPIWLAIKETENIKKVFTIVFPYFIFLISFLPYWREGSQGIIQNVFLYDSWNNLYFYNLFVPGIIKIFFSGRVIWMAILLFFAFYFKGKSNIDCILIYSCILVFASPAITNQYLAIVIPYLAINYKNPIALLYSIIGMWFLLIDSNGLHFDFQNPLAQLSMDSYYPVLILLLLMVFITSTWRESIKSQFLNFSNKFKN